VVRAPLGEGEKIGELEIYFERRLIGRIDLLAGNEVKKLTIWEKLKRKWGGGEKCG
jgi:hypothetical protein